MTQNRIFTDDEFADMVKELYSDNDQDQLSSTEKFRNVIEKCQIAKDNAAIDKIIQIGIIPRLVNFLQIEEYPQLQSEAAKILRQFASATTEQTKLVIDAGTVPILIKLLSANDENVQEQAVWVLGNIAADCTEYRDLLLDQKIVTSLIVLLRTPALTKIIIWTICNLCRGKTPPPDYTKVSQFLGPVSFLINSEDAEILADTCWTLTFLCDGSSEKIEHLLKTGISKNIVELLKHDSLSVVVAALRVVGNISMGDDDQTQVLLNFSILTNLMHLLSNPDESIRKLACWVISNITAGNQPQIQAVIDEGILLVLIDILRKDELKTKREAAWSVVNVIDLGTSAQIEYLVTNGCIPTLCDLLTEGDVQLIEVALNGLDYIMRSGEDEAKHKTGNNIYACMIEDCFGVEKIEKVQHLEDADICEKARNLIERYFYSQGRMVTTKLLNNTSNEINLT